MKTEEQIKSYIKWLESEIDGVNRGTIKVEDYNHAIKYYKSIITTLEWVLEE